MSVAQLDPQQTTDLQNTLATTFQDSGTLYRQGTSRTAGGGESNAYAPVGAATNVPCRIAPTARLPKEYSADETVLSESVWVFHTHVSTGPSDPTTFFPSDRWQITFAASGNVLMFEILATVPDRSVALERRAYCKLVM